MMGNAVRVRCAACSIHGKGHASPLSQRIGPLACCSLPVTRIVLTVIVAVICLLHTPPARACSPPPGPPPTLLQQIDAAKVVFSGRVVATGGRIIGSSRLPNLAPITDRGMLGGRYERFFTTEFGVALMPYYAEVEVEQYYKGAGIGEVVVMGFGYGTDCLNSAEPGDVFLFFTTGESPLFSLRYLYPNGGVAVYDARAQQELAQAALDELTLPDGTTAYVWIPVWVAGAGALLLSLRGLGMLIRR